MEMETFWNTVPKNDKLTMVQVTKRFPGAVSKLGDVTSNFDFMDFAFSVIPNCGPGGPTANGDEKALATAGQDSDECFSNGPSVSGAMALMAYDDDQDELYTWKDGSWILWNY